MAGLILLTASSLLMAFKIEIPITRIRILCSLVVHLSLVLGWFYCIEADWIVCICVFVWYLCAWCLSVFNREVKGKT